jgi:hypothetical protein
MAANRESSHSSLFYTFSFLVKRIGSEQQKYSYYPDIVVLTGAKWAQWVRNEWLLLLFIVAAVPVLVLPIPSQ